MVKVRDDHPLMHDGTIDEQASIEGLLEQTDIAEPEVIRRAIQLAKYYADEAIINRTYWTIDCSRMGLEMAQILAELKLDQDSICAAILYRAVREGRLSLQKVEAEFGKTVTGLIEGVLKMAAISAIQSQSDDIVLGQDGQVDHLRKMLVAMIDDVRVALIKLAERTSAIRAVKDAPQDKRMKVAKEVHNIYAPLAHRLGIGHIKWELEDLSFRYLEPYAYKKIAKLLDEKRLDRQKYIEEVIGKLSHEVERMGIESDINGRVKHIYSIWKKMQRKKVDFSQIYDIRAVRILVPEVRDCYAVLGIIHSLWRHIPNEFDDYIANPKENGYRSLHTAVLGPGGKVLEVQVRTHEMHEDAELGVCAHWVYKGTDTKTKDSGYEEKIAWLRQVMEWHEQIGDLPNLIEDLRADISPDRIYVFTPDGHVVDLPPEATPLDFAYKVHTEIGHRTRGAKVNGRIVPLTYELNNGEQVEILTAKQERPSRDWLSSDSRYVKTAKAKSKISHWFKLQAKDTNIEEGRQMIMAELERLDLQKVDLTPVAEHANMSSNDDMFAAIGAGDLRLGQVINWILKNSNIQPQQQLPLLKPVTAELQIDEDGVSVCGVGNLLTTLAKCCQPVPGDEISGFVTLGRGVAIHRQDCDNLQQLQSNEQKRIITVDWGEKPKQVFPVDIEVGAYERDGLLRDVTLVLASEQVNVTSLNTASHEDLSVSMTIGLELDTLAHLGRALTKLSQLPNVFKARRLRQH